MNKTLEIIAWMLAGASIAVFIINVITTSYDFINHEKYKIINYRAPSQIACNANGNPEIVTRN